MWFGDMTFDPVSGAIVSKVLKDIEQELFEADWAEAKTRLGREPAVNELSRTPAQRRADAMVDMASKASTSPADGRRPEPLFSVFVGYETFEGMLSELADGTVIPPGSLLPWIDQAWIERIVMDGPSRVVDVGVTQRLFTGATRRAIQIRDRECFEELCDLTADNCQIDHIIPYAAGGPTTQDNGRVACGKHNRARHKHLRPDP
jgi:hypothetical protein